MASRKRAYSIKEQEWGIKKTMQLTTGYSDQEQLKEDIKSFMKRGIPETEEAVIKIQERINVKQQTCTTAIMELLYNITRLQAAERALVKKGKIPVVDVSDIDNQIRSLNAKKKTSRARQQLAAARLADEEDLGGSDEDTKDAELDADQDYNWDDTEEEKAPMATAYFPPRPRMVQPSAPVEPIPVAQVVTPAVAPVVPPAAVNQQPTAHPHAPAVAPVVHPHAVAPAVPPQSPGILASFFGRTAVDEDQTRLMRMKPIARMAYHKRQAAPDMPLSPDEEEALPLLKMFPSWLQESVTPEMSDRLLRDICAWRASQAQRDPR